jgi:hypothetical protein
LMLDCNYPITFLKKPQTKMCLSINKKIGSKTQSQNTTGPNGNKEIGVLLLSKKNHSHLKSNLFSSRLTSQEKSFKSVKKSGQKLGRIHSTLN